MMYSTVASRPALYHATSVANSGMNTVARSFVILGNTTNDSNGLAKIADLALYLLKSAQDAFKNRPDLSPKWLITVVVRLTDGARTTLGTLTLVDLFNRIKQCVNLFFFGIGKNDTNACGKVSLLGLTLIRTIQAAEFLDEIGLCSIAARLGNIPVLSFAIRHITSLSIVTVTLVFDIASNIQSIWKDHARYNASIELHEKILSLWKMPLEGFSRSLNVSEKFGQSYYNSMVKTANKIRSDFVVLKDRFETSKKNSEAEAKVQRSTEQTIFEKLYSSDENAFKAHFEGRLPVLYQSIYDLDEDKRKNYPVALLAMTRKWEVLTNNEKVNRAKPWVNIASNASLLFSIVLGKAAPWITKTLPVFAPILAKTSPWMWALGLVVSGTALASVMCPKCTMEEPSLTPEEQEILDAQLKKWAAKQPEPASAKKP